MKQDIPPLTPEQLTKKLKSARKKIKSLEKELDFEREARKKLEKTQKILMFNLRRVLSKLDMCPEFTENK
jgi:septal ring factor EnvC (AmiA/AmiB activator)